MSRNIQSGKWGNSQLPGRGRHHKKAVRYGRARDATTAARGAIVASGYLEVQPGLLLSLSPGRRTYRMARAVALVSLLVFISMVPFAKVRLAQLPSFIPTYESALILNDLMTSALLFGQFAITRSRAMLALASGYLFTATAAIGHLLSFPGLFAPGGLLGAGPQSTAWIYMFWHAGFPLFVMAYAVLKVREDREPDRFAAGTLKRRTTVLIIPAVLGAAGACVALATAGQDWLPAIMVANRYTSIMWMVAGATWCFCVVALAVLWRSKPHLTLDIWLMVVLCVWICDVALSAVFNGGRYDLGFYAGRIFGLMGASFILLLLLIENSVLHSRLAAARTELKRLAANDPLTGIASRHTFESGLSEAWQRGAHAGSPLSSLMIEIDGFKDFNDRYGQFQGDQCLIAVAQCLAKHVRRDGDLVARHGSGTFAMLLQDTDLPAAEKIAQRLREAVVTLAIPHVRSAVAGHVTVSVGVASGWGQEGVLPQVLIKAADGALDEARGGGGDGVVGVVVRRRLVRGVVTA
ncbi:GGDEF domain-containing protein [Ralstonia pseudosolanacearum]|uniref:GGDEF domain-containing protein n=1 Tax=Ralstonia pseudosolanacearum TaxID=1310165 RepID=UPI001E624A02|nr:GGDEF domain-containing protein [Ralstonia pseudosolanacearum]UYR09749.1 diguanylate cyclase [Ralstonia pseudosolanacearum]UYR14408.1 diguanylate cyclase [Ralstonia pseudosolanacearum]